MLFLPSGMEKKQVEKGERAAGMGAQRMYPALQAGPAESIRALGASAFSESTPCPAEL